MTLGRALVLFAVLPCATFAHVIPDDVSIQVFAKPEGARLHLLVRVPFNALADIIFPTRAGGELDLPQTSAMLPNAAKTWISDWIDLYENGALLPKPKVMETRVSLPSDDSFFSYNAAWTELNGPDLPSTVQVFPGQAMLDVLFDYPVGSDRSNFSIHSRLARLGGKVSTALQFLPAGGGVRGYRYEGNPGLFSLDATRTQAVQRFLPLGFWQIVKGTDYLLFLFCVALLFRRFGAMTSFVIAFTAGHLTTLFASAYSLVPDALWFPVLFETLIALSILYMALENIVGGTPVQYRWMIAAAFGLVYGFGFSFALRQALQFGGVHSFASTLSFHAGIELGQLLLLGTFTPLLNLIFTIGVPERIGTIFLAALAGHSGWHRMLDRAKWLRAFQWPTLDPAVTASVLRWTVIFTALAAVGYMIFGARALAKRNVRN